MTRKFSDLGTKLSSYWYKIGIFSKEILGTTKTQDRKEMLVSDKRNSRHQQPPPQLHTIKSSLSTTFTPHLCSPWRKVPQDLHLLLKPTRPPYSKYLGSYLPSPPLPRFPLSTTLPPFSTSGPTIEIPLLPHPKKPLLATPDRNIRRQIAIVHLILPRALPLRDPDPRLPQRRILLRRPHVHVPPRNAPANLAALVAASARRRRTST